MSPTPNIRIALIHALEESVHPARAAFCSLWPQAYSFDLLDTSLAVDLSARGMLDDEMVERFQTLASYVAGSKGRGGETAGILFTCSAFGPAIARVKSCLSIPVLSPNESAFAAALQTGTKLGLVVSFAPSQRALQTELEEMAASRGHAIQIRSILAEGALSALKEGRAEQHDQIIAATAARLSDVDAIILGQFSMARAFDATAQLCAKPVFTTPRSAVEAMRTLVTGQSVDRSG
jgi:Asp/Glu/hydantoin racemase